MHPLIAVLDVAGRPVPIGSYGVAFTLALWLGAGLTVRAAARAGYDVGATIAVAGLTVGGGFVGAVALHASVQLLRGAPPAAMGGLACIGGLLAGLATLRFAARMLGVPWLSLADRAAVPVGIAHAVGRVGCLLGGCCYGAAWDGPLAVRYDHPLAPAHADFARHPWPVYEALGLCLLALVLALRPQDLRVPGRRMLAYLAGYGVLRLALEPLRDDAVRGVWAGGVSTGQLCAATLVLGAALAAWRRPQRRAALSPGVGPV